MSGSFVNRVKTGLEGFDFVKDVLDGKYSISRTKHSFGVNYSDITPSYSHNKSVTLVSLDQPFGGWHVTYSTKTNTTDLDFSFDISNQGLLLDLSRRTTAPFDPFDFEISIDCPDVVVTSPSTVYSDPWGVQSWRERQVEQELDSFFDEIDSITDTSQSEEDETTPDAQPEPEGENGPADKDGGGMSDCASKGGSDENLWLIDLYAPFGGGEYILKELRESVFKDQKVKSLQPAPDGSGMAVVEW